MSIFRILCSISVSIVLTVFLLTCGCLIFSDGAETQVAAANTMNPNTTPPWRSILTAYGILAFQFDVHPAILAIQMDMTKRSRLPQAVVGAFAATLCMSGITTVITAMKYGTATQASILETLPTTVPLHFAAALIAIQLCLTSAVSNNALYQHMEDCLCISREFNSKRCVLRTILTILAVVIAESVPRFDLVMSLIGGTLTGPLVFILPPLFYIKMLSLQKKYDDQLAMESFTNIVYSKDQSSDVSRFMQQKFKEEFQSSLNLAQGCIWSRNLEKGLCMVIIGLSICMTVSTTYFNFTDAASVYSSFSKPCIYNVSSALLYL